MTLSFPKPHSYRFERYMQFIRRQPCIITLCKGASEAAHQGSHGLGIKADDFRTLPICHLHHQSGRDSLHHLGPQVFEELYGLDLKELQIRFLIRFLTEELGCDDDKETK